MKINEFDNEVTQKQLDVLEMYIDKVFNKIGIDVEFTRHFLDRVNDERNVKQITIKELGALFAKEYKRWGKPIAQMGPDQEAVMKDLESDINIPFALRWNGKELELIAKTVMRKKNFRTPNKEFPVESTQIDELSPETLTNYIGKASDARGHRNLPTHKVDNRYAGVYRANAKLDRANRDINRGDFVSHAGKVYRVFGFTGSVANVGEYYGNDSYGGTKKIHITKLNKVVAPQDVTEHNDPSSYVKTIRKAGYSIYVSKIAGGEGGLRFEVETPSGKEFEVIERETGHYELFKNGPTMSGKGEVFGSLMDAIRAAETINEDSAHDPMANIKSVIEIAYDYFDKNPAKDTLDSLLIFEKDGKFNLIHNRNQRQHSLRDEGWKLVGVVNSDRSLTLAPKYKYAMSESTEHMVEDLGSIPPLTDLIIMAVVGQTTVAALKAAYKTGKYALKLKRLADRAGVKLNNAVMGESNESVSLDDYYNDIIKAFKEENPRLVNKLSGIGWSDHGTISIKDMNGDLWDYNPENKKLTLMTEAINRDDYNPYSHFQMVNPTVFKNSDEYKAYLKKNHEEKYNEKYYRVKYAKDMDNIKTKEFDDLESADKFFKKAKNAGYEAQVYHGPYPLEQDDSIGEAVNRDEYAAKLAAKQQDKFFAAALSALDRLVKSDPRGQDVGGYAFDIARAFQGVNGRELARAYNEFQ
jgi:hypothetical protein